MSDSLNSFAKNISDTIVADPVNTNLKKVDIGAVITLIITVLQILITYWQKNNKTGVKVKHLNWIQRTLQKLAVNRLVKSAKNYDLFEQNKDEIWAKIDAAVASSDPTLLQNLIDGK